ncbi:TrbI/VirB10 family protein [Cysteiniphilum sp. JM-1]|uniref:TrbI/VirB10 family protein n=1 Tax=Cysteiniphilum sp. JM-1 TaxID=2610891 RepID=UPI00124598A8|nr:TrbI/VirB10 family protein [Cysteiniphilum sp. JM-1]
MSLMRKLIKKPSVKLLGIAVIGVCVISIYFGGNEKSGADLPPSKIDSIKQSKNKIAYQELMKKYNEQIYDEAEKNGKSYIESTVQKYNKQELESDQQAQSRSLKDRVHSQSNILEKTKKEYVKQQQSVSHDQQIKENVEIAEARDLQDAFTKLKEKWGRNYTLTTTKIAVDDSSEKTAHEISSELPPRIQAGEILFAVIHTSVNSDQKGTPVLAEVVTGEYKGAKLIGAFQLADKSLVIKFNMLALPGQKALAIDAFAVDPDSAQMGMASDVDNHYLSRYGSLFAASFLEGFGNAFNQSSNYYIYPYDQKFPIQREVTVDDAIASGLGQMGTAMADEVKQNFRRPPTVTLNQGTSIGVLFNKDVMYG